MKPNYKLIGSLESTPKVGTPAVITVGGKKVKTSPVIRFTCKDKETRIVTKHSIYTVAESDGSGKAVKSVVGTLLTPVYVGFSAKIAEGHQLRQTSNVESFELGSLVSRVETRNTIYFVWGPDGSPSFR